MITTKQTRMHSLLKNNELRFFIGFSDLYCSLGIEIGNYAILTNVFSHRHRQVVHENPHSFCAQKLHHNICAETLLQRNLRSRGGAQRHTLPKNIIILVSVLTNCQIKYFFFYLLRPTPNSQDMKRV